MDSRLRRDIFLRKLRLERCYKPKALVANPDWQVRSPLRYIVAAKILESEDFTFLQIGAFDGVSGDHIRELVERYHIRGILVEPQKEAFEELTKNYSGNPNLTLVNAAISDADEIRDFYTVSGSVQVASFDKSHLLKHGIPAREIATQRVQCFSVKSILHKHGFKKVDLIQIDAEGYDYEIIKTIDLQQLRPSIIMFEQLHLSNHDRDECIATLASHGYHFLVDRMDIVACLDPQPAAKSTAA